MQSLRTSRWKLGEYVGFYSHFNHPERDWETQFARGRNPAGA